jgi:hypothetical protein
MLELADHPAQVNRLGRQAQAFAEQLTWDGAARATEAHLRQVIESGPDTETAT